ncbi:MAG TPA: hypothetical protein VGU45_00285 [Microvirga sp.]|jgi:hypothetical protein|nr:hypothetical protein [Microvirga sp.]
MPTARQLQLIFVLSAALIAGLIGRAAAAAWAQVLPENRAALVHLAEPAFSGAVVLFYIVGALAWVRAVRNAPRIDDEADPLP